MQNCTVHCFAPYYTASNNWGARVQCNTHLSPLFIHHWSRNLAELYVVQQYISNFILWIRGRKVKWRSNAPIFLRLIFRGVFCRRICSSDIYRDWLHFTLEIECTLHMAALHYLKIGDGMENAAKERVALSRIIIGWIVELKHIECSFWCSSKMEMHSHHWWLFILPPSHIKITILNGHQNGDRWNRDIFYHWQVLQKLIFVIRRTEKPFQKQS